MDIKIVVREGRKVMSGGNANIEKWKDYEEVVVEGGEELRELVEMIKLPQHAEVVEEVVVSKAKGGKLKKGK
jgi:hypothetical protein